MKKLIVVISLLVSFSNTFSQSACVNFHKVNCLKQIDGWIYNSQSKSGLFKEGTISRLRVVVYTGFDYRISICTGATFAKSITYKVFDSPGGELIADSKTLPTKEFIFQNTNSHQLTIEVEVPKGENGNDIPKSKDDGCVGLLLFQRVTQ